MKRIIDLLLVLTLVLSLLPVGALAANEASTEPEEVIEEEIVEKSSEAEEPAKVRSALETEIAVSESAAIVTSGDCGESGSNVTWTLDSDGTLTISGSGQMKDYETWDFDNISPWEDNESITKIVIQSGVTSIGDCSFYHCAGVTSLTIPSSVTSIGELAFYGCESLSSVTIPGSVANIGAGAFFACGNLSSVTMQSGVKSIGEEAFNLCENLTNISIPESATDFVGDPFFETPWEKTQGDLVVVNGVLLNYQGNADTVIIPDTVTSIGTYPFSECYWVTSVTIPASVMSIGRSAFFSCGLNSVTFMGDAPTIEIEELGRFSGVFNGVTATVYYPAGNSTWTSEVRNQLSQNANLTWVAMGSSGSTGIKGDINGDGEVTLKDVTKLFQFVNKQITTLGDANGDMNGDGEVTLKDVTRLFQFVNKQISTLD